MPMVTVSISPLQAAGIRSAVDTGVYASSSEVVREALRMWDAARKRGELRSFSDAAAGDETRNTQCVAEMFSDYEAKSHRLT
ncbi:ribbon-helix-helix domain-containing protein [Rhizobium sp. RAF56]|jgi:antitoxin ParD1/3/4|uniref:ribbon-helix-helix domain-containing protein n=1 Tax=Rhizobium sp. RAF56 TaxID=3233062 RepID=UPI003F983E56